MALAWLAKKPWIVPIPGIRRLERLEEHLGAADLDMNPQDVAKLDEASARIDVTGERYPEQMQRMMTAEPHNHAYCTGRTVYPQSGRRSGGELQP